MSILLLYIKDFCHEITAKQPVFDGGRDPCSGRGTFGGVCRPVVNYRNHAKVGVQGRYVPMPNFFGHLLMLLGMQFGLSFCSLLCMFIKLIFFLLTVSVVIVKPSVL